MNQRTLLIALVMGAVVLLGGAALFVGDGTFNIFGGGSDQRAVSTGAGTENDPFGEQDHNEDAKFDGRDEHGRYVNGPDAQRIYTDSNGRRYVFGPGGKRTFVDMQGREVGPDGKPIERSSDTGTPERLKPDQAKDATADEEEEEPEQQTKLADLSGAVVDDNGKPYEGAQVGVQVTGAESRSTTTDEAGNFGLTKLPAETVLVLTASDDYGNSSKPFTTRLAAGATKLKSPLVLPRDTAIRGVVRDQETGLPVDGAQVVLFSPSDLRKSEASQAADQGGAFAFTKLTPGAYRIEVSSSGYVPRILNSVEPPGSLVIELSPGAVVSGTVSDTGGNPIAGAQISCDFRAEPAQYFHTEATTDEQGRYVVKCQPESQHNSVSVLAAGFKSASRTLVRSGSERQDFSLVPSGNVVLRGRLLTTSGVPIQTGTFFSYDAQAKYLKIVQSVGPNSEGTFWCETLPEAVELLVRSTGLAEVRAQYQPSPGTEVDLGDLYMGVGYSVYGVITKRGEPETKVEAADISVGAAKTKSAKDGTYRIDGLSAEEFIVRVLHAAYLGTAVKVTPTAGQHEIELNLELSNADFSARVRITDSQTQEPIEGALLTLTAYAQTFSSAADGMIHIEGLSSLKVDARIEKPGFATVFTKIDADQPDKTAAKPPQEIALVYGNTISGVCSSNGEPLPGATRVEVWGTAKLEATVYTDTDGHYATESLPTGTYFVGLPDYHYAARTVELTEEGAEFDVELGAMCHLRGRLLRADGQPHANAGIYIYRRDHVYWASTVHTDPTGHYEVTNLFPGEWVFCALKTQGDTAAQFAVNVNVSKAGWNDVDVQLPSITGVITGRVTYTDGQPVRKARVSVTNLSANFPRALLAAYVVTDEDGYYTAERLENGNQMQVRVGGYVDEAQTGTAFGEVVVIPNDNSPVEVNLVVASSGVTVRASMRRADNGPILNGGPLCYLFDASGRLSGLYFGGGTYTGFIDMYDVVPGTYTLVVCNRGMKRAEVEFTVGSQAVTSGVEVILEPEQRGSGE